MSRPAELIGDSNDGGDSDSTPLIELVKDGVLDPVKSYLRCHPTAVGEEDLDVSDVKDRWHKGLAVFSAFVPLAALPSP